MQTGNKFLPDDLPNNNNRKPLSGLSKLTLILLVFVNANIFLIATEVFPVSQNLHLFLSEWPNLIMWTCILVFASSVLAGLAILGLKDFKSSKFPANWNQ